MEYIVSITYHRHREFIAEGRNYTVNGASFVPVTERESEAKRYKTRRLAEMARNRNGENMWGTIEIIEVEG